MVPFVKNFIVNQAMSASFDSHEEAPQFYRPGCSIQLVWTGAPVGDFKLACSNDGTTWDDIPDSTVAAGGATGHTMYNLSDAFYRLVRVTYTRTSGTGTVNGYYY